MPGEESTTAAPPLLTSVPSFKPKRKRDKKLKSEVLKQLEFYFSDVNVHKSRFMKEKMFPSESPNGNPVQISTLMTFNKLISMGATPEVVKKCVKDSSMLTLGEDGHSIVRTRPIKEPANVDDRTVYVENIPAASNHESLKSIFSKFGVVEYVSLPKFKTTGDIKGFAFVEFADVESARSACGEPIDNGDIDVGAALPEVKQPAVLPRMNRAMAALAKVKEKLDDEEDGKDVASDVLDDTSDVATKGTDDSTTTTTTVPPPSSSPLKRRRAVGEEEEEEEKEAKKKSKKMKRQEKTKSASPNEVNKETDVSQTNDAGDSAAKVDDIASANKEIKRKISSSENDEAVVVKKQKIAEEAPAVNGTKPLGEESGRKKLRKKKRKKKTSKKVESEEAEKMNTVAEAEPVMIPPSGDDVENNAKPVVPPSGDDVENNAKPVVPPSGDVENNTKPVVPLSGDDVENNAKPVIPPSGDVENNAKPDVKDLNTEEAGAGTDSPAKKKNRRKKLDKAAKRLKKTTAAPVPKMSVMPKTKWLSLRNEYLTLQRQRMSALKQNLSNARTEERDVETKSKRDGSNAVGSNVDETCLEGTRNNGIVEMETSSLKKPPTRSYEKVNGLIVKVSARQEDHALPPRSLIKTGFEKEPLCPSDESKGNVSIAYMDIEEGQIVGHIRCSNSESARRILDLGLLNFDVTLLTGQAEDDYWEKLRLDRESRKKTANKKKKPNRANNGFKKIVERATTGGNCVGGGVAAGGSSNTPKTHMRFDDE